MRRIVLRMILGFSSLALIPSSSFAQGAIAGQVADTSGAIMPGVNVEATSPALIEGARTAVTDGGGRYQITDLRPGTYKVTFTLPGFRTIVREGIDIATGFTATINIQMAVGAVEETITVAGAAPVVDVQSVTTQTVMTREILDVVPTGRNIQAIGILIPGTGLQVGGGASYNVDVGGSAGMQQSPLAYHGNTNSVQQVDGIRFNNMEGAGQYSGMYWNDAMIQEIQYTTSGDSAETQAGGVRINMIPKEGGNTFRGTLFSNFTHEGWHSDNLDQSLKDRGLQSVGKIQRIWDFNPSLGGPLKRDTLWFHFAYRNWGVNRTVPGSFSEFDPSRPSIDDSYINSGVLRLTWQIDEKNKLGAHYDRNHKYRGHWGLASNVSEEAAAIEDMPQSYNASVKWTSTITNQLLGQAGIGLYTQQYREIYEPELPTAPGQVVNTFPITNRRYDPYFTNIDTGINLIRGAFRSGNIIHISGVRNYIASLSYVTGSQSFKVGMQYQEGISRQHDYYNGAMEIRWLNGNPNQALLRAVPTNMVENIRDLGLYVDEKWTLDRLTLSGGLRFDYFNGYAPEQWSPAGPFIGARMTPRRENIPNWRDVNPRLGISYDLFGNAKTALKFTMGRYVDQAVAAPTRALNPMRQIASTDTRSWLADTNGNMIPDLNELGATSNTRFGTIVESVRFDQEYVDGFGARPGHWNYHGSVQHELRPGLGVSATYSFVKLFNTLLPATRTNNFGRGPDNLRWTAADFDEFTIVVPDDPRLPADLRGTTITGLYVIKDASRPNVDDYRSFARNYGGHKENYNGVDLNINWRMGNGGNLGGGTTWGNSHINDCYVVDDPTQMRFCDRNVDPNSGLVRGGFQVKLLGSYPLIAGWQLSGSLQSVRGPEKTAAWTSRDFNGTIRFPNSARTSLGQTPSITVQLIEPGTLYDDRLVQLDLRGSKTFGFGGRRVRVMIDLYNALNNNAVLQRAAFGGLDTYGATWGRPLGILEGRLFKVGAQLDF